MALLIWWLQNKDELNLQRISAPCFGADSLPALILLVGLLQADVFHIKSSRSLPTRPAPRFLANTQSFIVFTQFLSTLVSLATRTCFSTAHIGLRLVVIVKLLLHEGSFCFWVIIKWRKKKNNMTHFSHQRISASHWSSTAGWMEWSPIWVCLLQATERSPWFPTPSFNPVVL